MGHRIFSNILVILANVTALLQCQEELKFKIGLPEYICDKNGVKNINQDVTTIRFLGKDATDLNYNFDVNFERIGAKCRNQQRCNLLAWRAIRELDKYLKQYPQSEIKTGLIEINNTMFMPGLKYIIKVNISNGERIIEEKRLMLDYVDESVKKAVQKPLASITLLGVDTSYAYVSNIINAETIMCSNINLYHYKWEIIDTSRNRTIEFNEKGSQLQIAANTLQATNDYVINCYLLDSADNSVIVKGSHTISILSKGLLVILPVTHITTIPNAPVSLRTYIQDLDNPDNEYQISWACIDANTGEDCDYQSELNEVELDSSFEKSGKYKLTLVVKRDEYLESRYCDVDVIENAPTIEFGEIEQPFAINKDIFIPVTVFGLQTFCTLQWNSPISSINNTDYEVLDTNRIPGNLSALINITSLNTILLEEIDEFDTNTIERNHDLLIPAKSEKWSGLKGDVKYLFRLTITCPENLNSDNETMSNNATIMTNDFVIETNSPPEISSLMVTPNKGEAFVTKFSFKTTKSHDKDEPILYKFGIVLEKRELYFTNIAEVINTELKLPYSRDGIKTVLEICDSFSACSRISGPVISTDFPEAITDTFFANIMQEFHERIVRGEYYKAFAFAIGIIHSFESVGNVERAAQARDLIAEKITAEIDKYLNATSDEFWRESVNDLIENVLSFNNESNTDMKVLERVISKLNELQKIVVQAAEKYTQRRLLSTKSHDSLNLQTVKNYLQLSEITLNTLNDSIRINSAKNDLRKDIHHYMMKLCNNLYKKAQIIQLEMKSFVFAVEKINKKDSVFVIPFEGNAWNISARIKVKNPPEAEKKCMGKAIFKDYLEKNGFTFMAEYLNGDDDDRNNNDAALDVLVSLPIDKLKETQQYKCVVYARDEWHNCDNLKVRNGYLKCACKYLGYYYASYSNNKDIVPSTTTSLITTDLLITEFVTTSENLTNNDSLSDQLIVPKSTNYTNISYVVIVGSIIGIIIVGLVLRHIFNEDDEDDYNNEQCDFPKYAKLHDEDLLQEGHI